MLPVQIIRLGQFFLPAVTFEVSSMAGYRIRNLIRDEIKKQISETSFSGLNRQGQVKPVIEVLALSNGYTSYLTTMEEFSMQHYEGASTLFGPLQLNATLFLMRSLAQSFSAPCLQESLQEQLGCRNETSAFIESLNTDQLEIAASEPADASIAIAKPFSAVFHHWLSQEDLSRPTFSTRVFSPGSLHRNIKADTLFVLDEMKDKIVASFYCVHPMNSQKHVTSFCDVEKRDVLTREFDTFLTDTDWNVRFLYRKQYLFFHVCTCEWIPQNNRGVVDIPSGEYRLKVHGAFHNTDYQPKNASFHAFSGVSNAFRLISSDGTEKHETENSLYSVEDYVIFLADDTLFILTGALFLCLKVLSACCRSPPKVI